MMERTVFFCMIFLTTAMAGCVETITLDPGEENLPVMVNCLLSPDNDVQTLYLQYVKGKSAVDYIPIKDADVYLIGSFLGKLDTLYFNYVEENVWEARDEHKRIRGGEKYSLSVEMPGREAIHAVTRCPFAFRPKLFTDLHEVNSMDLYSIYYQIEVNPADYDKEIWTSPVWVFAKGKHKKYEDCDEYYPYLVTDHPYSDDFNINGLKFKDLLLDGESDGTTCAISWQAFHNMRRMMPELPLHDDFVRIDHLDTARFHILAGPLECPQSGEPHQDHFVFMFVSDEYDKYLRSVYVKNRKIEHDITTIYSTENVYSNIEGGVGVFGSEINYRIVFLSH